MDNEVEEFREFISKYHKCMNKVWFTFERYSKSIGISFINVRVLVSIYFNEGCTQKYISDTLFISKQTVNLSINYFIDKGYIKLIEPPENRRIKTIHLTTSGKKYAEKIASNISECQSEVIKGFGAENMKTLINNLDYFVQIYCKSIENLIKK